MVGVEMETHTAVPAARVDVLLQTPVLQPALAHQPHRGAMDDAEVDSMVRLAIPMGLMVDAVHHMGTWAF